MTTNVVADRIRVLHLGSPTGLYGAERWILALVRHLAPQQIESVVGAIQDAPGAEPSLCREAMQLGVPACVFEARGRLSAAAIGQLASYIRHNRIDILHTHGYKSDFLGLFAARLARCSILSTPHGWSTDAGVKLQMYEALDRFILGLLDAVVPLSDDLYEGLARAWWWRPRLHLIRNAVDLAEIDEVTESCAALRAARHGGCGLIGYIGQLIPRKGVDTLIRAFSRLETPARQLCIVGDGPARGSLERLAADLGETHRVRFLGYRQDRIALLKALDVFVLPSSLEGIPRCVLESMAAGVPVVASDIPGCRTVVQDGVTGLLFPPGDVAGLASSLRQLLADPALRSSLAARAEALVRREFSAEGMAVRYAKLYRELAARRRSRAAALPGPAGAR
ncbi:MAG: glycosyltransferase [Steroidobacteraceae bacterium]